MKKPILSLILVQAMNVLYFTAYAQEVKTTNFGDIEIFVGRNSYQPAKQMYNFMKTYGFDKPTSGFLGNESYYLW